MRYLAVVKVPEIRKKPGSSPAATTINQGTQMNSEGTGIYEGIGGAISQETVIESIGAAASQEGIGVA